MVIRRTARFNRELKTIFDFIAKDSPNRARDFRDKLIAKLQTISDRPFMYRKSASFDDESIRDLIFKSYVIPYAIEDEAIYVLGIYGANKWQT
nr:type II toxin-antitoxin system RelE/ParE family toxin [uncultured Campylobacter sp.]